MLCCKCVVIVCAVCVFVHMWSVRVWDCGCMCGTVGACMCCVFVHVPYKTNYWRE